MIWEGKSHKKSFGTLFFRVLLKNYLETISLVAGSSINAVQSLQLEHDGLSNLHMELIVFPPWQESWSLKIAIFQEED